MGLLRRILLSLALVAGLVPATSFAQPAPVPALPDSERRTSYSISASTCACAVGFQLFGDSTDYANWLEVFVNGVQVPQSGNWNITSPSGSLATLPRPITDAVLTFTANQTGTVQIVGARRPRRTTQFQESQPVPTRNFNVAFSDIIAVQREYWDKLNDVTGRVLMGLPGEQMVPLPPAASRAGNFICFDGTGLIPSSCPPANGSGNVTGPGSATDGNVPVFSGASGRVLRDSGGPPLVNNGGTDTNTPNAKTANYTAVTGDCGKTITLGGSAFFTLTVGAPAGYAATCSIVVINTDTGRAKAITISGVGYPAGGFLWPLQSFILKNENNAWTLVGAAPRWKFTTPQTLTVDTAAGNDNNDGLASGSGNAMATLGAAIGRACAHFDINAQLTIQLTTGQTHPSQTLCNYIGSVQPDGNNPRVQGDISSCALAANYTIDGGASIGIVPVGIYTPWTFQGVKITSSTQGTAIEADARSHLYLGTNVTFPAVTGFHVRSFYQSFVEFIGNYCITGGAQVHANSQTGGQILIQPGNTVTITGTPAFTSFFAQSTTNGLQIWTGTTFSGAATGPRFTAITGGGIDTAGAGATFLPGNAAGSATSPGWYN